MKKFSSRAGVLDPYQTAGVIMGALSLLFLIMALRGS